jgi:hypothetical protein
MPIPLKPVPPQAYIPKKVNEVGIATAVLASFLVATAGIIFTFGFFTGKIYTDRQYQNGTAAGLAAMEEQFLTEFGFTSKEEAKEDALELLEWSRRSSAE